MKSQRLILCIDVRTPIVKSFVKGIIEFEERNSKMIDALFDRDNEVNTGRQIEVDIAKTVCIIGMVLVHCFEYMTSKVGDTTGFEYVMTIVLNNLFGASTFMFCMGMGAAYSRSKPMDTVKRGFAIFILAWVLNAIRAGFLMLILYSITGNEEILLLVPEGFLSLDILHFAGLALVLFGLIRCNKNYRFWLPVIAILMSMIGSFARGLDTGNFYLNQIVGLFLGTNVAGEETSACFPLFNWFIFVVAGFLFGEIFKYCKDKGGFYLRFGIISWVIVTVYSLISIPNGIGMMGQDENYFFHMTTPEAFISVISAVAIFSVYYAISHFVKGGVLQFFTNTSKNINSIYCIHWVLILWISLPAQYIGGMKEISTAAVIIISIIIFIVSATIAQHYKIIKKEERNKGRYASN